MIFSIIVLSILVFGGLQLAFGNSSISIPSSNQNQPDNSTPFAPAPSTAVARIENGVQKIDLRAMSYGYNLPRITVKKGIPVEISFSADARAGCGRQIVFRDFGVNVIAQGDQTQVIRFTPEKAGTFEYACGMRMFVGQLIVQ